MVTKDFWVLLAMVLYFAAMLTIGFIYSKRSNSSTKQYFAGGRGVGPVSYTHLDVYKRQG